MKCNDARKAIVLDLYGELSTAEKTRLDIHLRACEICAAEREETFRVLALLLQNVLLQKALSKKDPASADLLDNIDLILKEIINRDRPTAASPASIRDLIRQRDVLFKLEILKKI